MFNLSGYQTAETRWSRLGPYYAMFPMDFAFNTINEFSNKGDSILDPFAGRGSSIYAGAMLGRDAYGIEINPVGWIYAEAKLNPAPKDEVIKRLEYLYSLKGYYKKQSKQMSAFFQMCFCSDVLGLLLATRKHLDWRNNQTDVTLMALILDSLHGNIGTSLSNKMHKTKAMGEYYSLNWWQKNNLAKPPEINPLELLLKKINWRYQKGIPSHKTQSTVVLGESSQVLKQNNKKFSLLFTSPPYYSVTNYHADQWLRLWLLGGKDKRVQQQSKNHGGFTDREHYYNLLDSIFSHSAALMTEKSVVYIRTDVRKFTKEVTLSILKKHFPYHRLSTYTKPISQGKGQTRIFKNKPKNTGETDIIMTN